MTGWGDTAYRLNVLFRKHWHAECVRLRAELAEQRMLNVRLADRLSACSEVLGRAAERGKVCECQHSPGEGRADG